MPLHFDLPWVSRLTNTITAWLLVPLIFVRELLLEDVPRGIFNVVKVYLRCARIILSTTMHYSLALLASYLQYMAFTLIWIYMGLRLCVGAYVIYIFGRSLQTICELAIKNPIYVIVAAMGITYSPRLFGSLAPLFKLVKVADQDIRVAIFNLNLMVAKKKKKDKKGRHCVIHSRVKMIDQGTQTVEAWDMIKEKVRIREMNRLDGHSYLSDEDWESDSEHGHRMPRRREMEMIYIDE